MPDACLTPRSRDPIMQRPHIYISLTYTRILMLDSAPRRPVDLAVSSPPRILTEDFAFSRPLPASDNARSGSSELREGPLWASYGGFCGVWSPALPKPVDRRGSRGRIAPPLPSAPSPFGLSTSQCSIHCLVSYTRRGSSGPHPRDNDRNEKEFLSAISGTTRNETETGVKLRSGIRRTSLQLPKDWPLPAAWKGIPVLRGSAWFSEVRGRGSGRGRRVRAPRDAGLAGGPMNLRPPASRGSRSRRFCGRRGPVGGTGRGRQNVSRYTREHLFHGQRAADACPEMTFVGNTCNLKCALNFVVGFFRGYFDGWTRFETTLFSLFPFSPSPPFSLFFSPRSPPSPLLPPPRFPFHPPSSSLSPFLAPPFTLLPPPFLTFSPLSPSPSPSSPYTPFSLPPSLPLPLLSTLPRSHLSPCSPPPSLPYPSSPSPPPPS
ncbi:hypothetical protein C7M84_019161 [Penaeus vannamei]|uniref:Uncharacterized protein n=1 Tax=Penaeus vannamei TaxID=6689 RepID=A0A423SFK3_PENVA|nr:hypothetical protein C7M84_019161 [Penaeus vannamei]